MMVSVHAAVGAAVGAALGRRVPAFLGGVVSHLVCDLVPHKDYEIQIEAPLAAAMFGFLAWRFGIDSPQFWGAAGAVAPDAENALVILGALAPEQTVFPTHNESASWFVGHGHKVSTPAPQIALALLALWLATRKPAP